MQELGLLALAARFTGGDACFERGHDRGSQQGAQGLAVARGVAAHDGLIGLTRALQEAGRIEARIARLEPRHGGGGGRIQTRHGRRRRRAAQGRGLGQAGVFLRLAPDLLAQHVVEHEQQHRGDDGEHDDLELDGHGLHLIGARPGGSSDAHLCCHED
ncbi:hypothetical protein D3C80_1417490 [compost metagenome]